MANEIKAGDIVMLKSVGPRMTVSSVGDLNGQLTAWCDWFQENKPMTQAFAVVSLKKISD